LAEIAKANRQRNVADAAQLLKLAEEVKADIDKDDVALVSAKTIKSLADIDKLAKSMKGRLKNE
jgi:hypothetical protein